MPMSLAISRRSSLFLVPSSTEFIRPLPSSFACGSLRVFQESSYAHRSERMIDHLSQYSVRHRGDMCPHLRSRNTMQRVADAGGNNPGTEAVAVKTGHDVGHQGHAILTDIVEPSDKGTDVGGPPQRTQQ